MTYPTLAAPSERISKIREEKRRKEKEKKREEKGEEKGTGYFIDSIPFPC
ncbi:MAG: hypothetical protein IIB53_14900 [Planctomycetes bacterium]|nr:hypothetical protein [Planctomycetota bacterium]